MPLGNEERKKEFVEYIFIFRGKLTIECAPKSSK